MPTDASYPPASRTSYPALAPSEPLPARLARIERLLVAARRIADEDDTLGQRARDVLPAATGLTRASVEYALRNCLETEPSSAELAELCERTPPVPRAHVLLSANVFVAAHRAIAIALAASARVEVRASRREPEMAALLHEGSRGAFHLVDELAPNPGDHVWAYGSDETLRALRGELPAGVVLHAHGAGIGVAVVESPVAGPGRDGALASAARGLAEDVIAFDQRGCLSPRLCLFAGDADAARRFVELLVKRLARLEHDVPRGALSREELADQTRYRDSMLYAAELFPAGKGAVGLDVTGDALVLPPIGRNLHVQVVRRSRRRTRPARRRGRRARPVRLRRDGGAPHRGAAPRAPERPRSHAAAAVRRPRRSARRFHGGSAVGMPCRHVPGSGLEARGLAAAGHLLGVGAAAEEYQLSAGRREVGCAVPPTDEPSPREEVVRQPQHQDRGDAND